MNPARRRLHAAALRLFAEKGSSEISVSELAQVAGVARGTVYNNVDSVDDLFQQIAVDLAEEMRERMRAAFVDERDPATRLAHGLRFFARRAHEEPGWGRFVARFGPSHRAVGALWSGPPRDDVAAGLRRDRFTIDEHLVPAMTAMIAGTTITSMWLVLDGHRTWRAAGSEAAELVLRALGIDPDDAHAIATAELPPLPDAPLMDDEQPSDPDPVPASAGAAGPS